MKNNQNTIMKNNQDTIDKMHKIEDIIENIYKLEDEIESLNFDKINDSNEFWDFKWIAVMLKDEQEKLSK